MLVGSCTMQPWLHFTQKCCHLVSAHAAFFIIQRKNSSSPSGDEEFFLQMMQMLCLYSVLLTRRQHFSLHKMTSRPPTSKCAVKSKIRLSVDVCLHEKQSCQISSRSNMKRRKVSETGVLLANYCEVCGWISPKVKILRGFEHLRMQKVDHAINFELCRTSNKNTVDK